MPIRPEKKDLYPSNWREISERIRFERAGNKCERCGAENGKAHPITGSKVVLTVMHLNHDPADCRDENLQAACQKCHNAYDAPYRAANRAQRKARADSPTPWVETNLKEENDKLEQARKQREGKAA